MSIDRIEKVLTRKEQLKTPRQPIKWLATKLSREAVAHAHSEVIIAALSQYIDYLYEDNCRWTINNYGRIHPPLLWGPSGQKQFGFERTDADVLRHTLVKLSGRTNRTLFKLDETGRNWYLNVERYPNAAAAKTWLNDEFKMDRHYFQDMWDSFKGFLDAK